MLVNFGTPFGRVSFDDLLLSREQTDRGETPAHPADLFKGRVILFARTDWLEANRAKAELLREVLGVEPGSVTALALVNDRERRISVVVDSRLMEYDVVNCHPLVNTATTSIARDDLVRFMRACGHEPRVIGLAAPAG